MKNISVIVLMMLVGGFASAASVPRFESGTYLCKGHAADGGSEQADLEVERSSSTTSISLDGLMEVTLKNKNCAPTAESNDFQSKCKGKAVSVVTKESGDTAEFVAVGRKIWISIKWFESEGVQYQSSMVCEKQ